MCSVAAGQTLADSADRDTNIDETLRDVFKMSDFRGNQRAAILAALRGRDTVVLMATGSGKILFKVCAISYRPCAPPAAQ